MSQKIDETVHAVERVLWEHIRTRHTKAFWASCTCGWEGPAGRHKRHIAEEIVNDRSTDEGDGDET